MVGELRRDEAIRRDMRQTLRRLQSRPRLVARDDWRRAHRADVRLHSKTYYPVTTDERSHYNKEFEEATGQRRSAWLTGDELVTLLNVSLVAIVLLIGGGFVIAFWWAILRAVGLFK